ncbi:zinc-binding dehydrogenase [Acrocarpospora macrocephala]|uniref:NADH oxidoreductase n=1 Tax=Acrocarpospora macrocephala TaxID=150177 RepID=A0A5M3WH66_9ACTN|nr:NADH oxidase [Acrocarpospora macrocephala]GES08477.1 NADH oxidoreductase [Acrocarpospora macrocephala]
MTTGLQLRSLVSSDGALRLSFVEVVLDDIGPDDVVVQVEATPLNPSDLRLLFGQADMSTLEVSGTGADRVVTAWVSPKALQRNTARLDLSLPVGNEGAGKVVAAGNSEAAQALLGKTVSMIGGSMYSEYRLLDRRSCQELPEGVDAVQGASWFINPMTTLAFLETMRTDGQRALVHTAAASNLGRMLNRVCIEDDVALVNIVRSDAQREILEQIGARYIVDSTSDTFRADLTAAISSTGAMVAFDATGGGTLAGQILSCMEAAARAESGEYSAYGTDVHKRVYSYGSLDTRPTEIVRDFGFAWSLSGWLLWPTLTRLGAEKQGELRERVVRSLTTTFASEYTDQISLFDVIDPVVLDRYSRLRTGEKYLIRPNTWA